MDIRLQFYLSTLTQVYGYLKASYNFPSIKFMIRNTRVIKTHRIKSNVILTIIRIKATLLKASGKIS